MEQYPKKLPPQVDSRLRHSILEMPVEIRKASGIVIYGRRIKSLVFTTDLAIIKNCDADAVFAVYPFTPQQSISDAIIKASYIPKRPTLDSGLHPVRRFSTSRAGRIPRRLCEKFARSTRIFRLSPPAAISQIPSPQRLRQAQTRLRLRRHPHRNCSKR